MWCCVQQMVLVALLVLCLKPSAVIAQSSLSGKGFDTEIRLGGNVKLHFALVPGTDRIRLAIDVPVVGWAALAIGNSMIDSDAVIGGGAKDSGLASAVREYHITSFSAEGIVRNNAAEQKLTDIEVVRVNGRTQVLFSRPLTNDLSQIGVEARTSVAWAFGVGNVIEYHGQNSRGSASLIFSGSTETQPEDEDDDVVETTNVPEASDEQAGNSGLVRYGLDSEADVGSGVKLHYGRGQEPNSIRLAVDVPTTGWAALAVGTTMRDADAVIGGGLLNGGEANNVNGYSLTATSRDGVVQNDALASQLSDTLVLQENGRTTVIFTRPLDNGVSQLSFDGSISLLWAYGQGNAIEYHAGRKNAFSINLATGTAEQDTSGQTHKVVHGVLMLSSWGFLIPFGTVAAASAGPRFQALGPRAFKIHRAVQSLGLVLALGGVGYAMIFVYGDMPSVRMPIHGIVGLAVMLMGILQPLNAVLRPHGHGYMRTAWEFLHKSVGRAATAGGLVNCILGAWIAREQCNDCAMFTQLLLVSLGLGVCFSCAFVGGKVWARRRMQKVEAAEAGKCDLFNIHDNNLGELPVILGNGTLAHQSTGLDEEMPMETAMKLETILAAYESKKPVNTSVRLPQTQFEAPESVDKEEVQQGCVVS